MTQRRRCSRIILGLVALGLLAGGALTAGPAQAVDAVGPYYAEPAWDQSLPAATRFVVLTNWGSHAVLDKETGLVWERTPSVIPTIWAQQARRDCTGRTNGGRKGWRLPSIPELASLIDPNVTTGLRLPLDHPFTNVQSGNYWSATTSADTPILAWFVNFDNGNVSTNGKGFNGLAWCVRGGNNAEAY